MERYIRNTAPDYYEGATDFTPLITEKFQELLTSHEQSYPPNITDSVDSMGTREDEYSIYMGCAGNLYMYWKLSQTSEIHEHNLNIALGAALRACDEIESTRDPITFLMGKVGIYTLQAVINRDRFAVQKVVEAEREAYNNKAQDELLYGNAGYLYCLLFIQKYWPGSPFVQIINEAIRRLCEALIKSGTQNGELHYSFPRGASKYLGGAHGTIGIIHILLQARSVIGSSYDQLLISSINAILNLQFESGNFPVIEDRNEDKLVHFCHGAGGAVPMLCLAYDIFKNPLYLDRAIRAGNCIWNRGLLKKGGGLCHGFSGNAYAFLRLYNVTQKKKWMYRAQVFAYKLLIDPEVMQEIAEYDDPQRKRRGMPDTPYSLMEGDAGTICFLNDLLHPDKASFPCYDI